MGTIKQALGPINAVINGSDVHIDPTGPFLELRLIMRLTDVKREQRNQLPKLIHSGDLLTLTLETAGGGEGG